MATSRSDPPPGALARSRWTGAARLAGLRGARLADPWLATPAAPAPRPAPRPPARAAQRRRDGGPELRAVMPGRVVALLVARGDTVAAGQGILVLEAMKMESELGAPRSGVVEKLAVRAGQAVESGELLAVIA